MGQGQAFRTVLLDFDNFDTHESLNENRFSIKLKYRIVSQKAIIYGALYSLTLVLYVALDACYLSLSYDARK
jgi:molybdopterin/thiamine biosynthesis adenylyltransferase